MTRPRWSDQFGVFGQSVVGSIGLGLVLGCTALLSGRWSTLSGIPWGIGTIGQRVWERVATFGRGQALIAMTEAILTAIVLAIIGVPLVLPLSLLTLGGGFIPLVGPVVAGTLATLVALSDEGITQALWILGAFVAIQQAEAYLLQPIMFGKTLQLHPLACFCP